MGLRDIPLHPDIIRAFNPYYAIRLLVTSPEWFLILGAVFLCTTGVEALYSDLGHCGRRNITISWLFVKLMLIFNYLGQGAWLVAHEGHTRADLNPFYAMLPDGWLIPSVILATLAAVIASQALISGVFTIFSEAISLNFWPALRIKYPSHIKGQLFIPSINLLLYLCCIVTILFFRSSENMEAAYGLSITVTMLMTTVLLVVYLAINRRQRMVAMVFGSIFIALEGIFFAANAFKFVHGGWFTILLASGFILVMYIWNNALRIRRKYLEFKPIKNYFSIIQDIRHDTDIPKTSDNLVFISKSNRSDFIESKVIYSIVNKQPKRADHYWLIHIENTDDPETLDYTFQPLLDDTIFQVSIRMGFRVRPFMTLYLRQIIEDLTDGRRFNLESGYSSLRKRHVPGSFKFIVIHRIYYPASAEHTRDNMIMALYAVIKHLGVKEEYALGLDTSNVVVEHVPLIVNNHSLLRRIVPRNDES